LFIFAQNLGMSLIKKIIFFFEMRSFGVSEWWARKLGIQTDKVRLGFIYASFFTFGSPLIIYLIMAWILEHKHYFKLQREKPKTSIWDL
jgi:phage shock protein C